MRTLAIILAATLLCNPAHSGVITLDFEDQARQYYFTNATIGGMQFSPRCPAYSNGGGHRVFGGSNYIQVDRDNNCGYLNNKNYLGNPDVWVDLWIDNFGSPFSLLGLDSVNPYYGGFMSFEVRSSKGGYVKHTGIAGPYTFDGDSWTGVQWITLLDTLGGFHQHHGWDNMMFAVADEPTGLPEPGTAWLMGLGGLALAFVTRRGRRSLTGAEHRL